MMRIPSSAEIVKRTKCVSDNKNPEWNEEPFVFHIDPEEHNVLGVSNCLISGFAKALINSNNNNNRTKSSTLKSYKKLA